MLFRSRNPSLQSVEKLAAALELSLPTLFERTGPNRHLVEILLIENDPRDAEMAMLAFERAKLTNPVHIAGDGNEALEFLFATGRHADRAEQPLPGVILLDLNLPRKSALEVLRQIKADPRTRGIPVVVLTVSNRDRDMNECRRLGAESLIVKPIDFQNFSEVTTRLSLSWKLIKPTENAF